MMLRLMKAALGFLLPGGMLLLASLVLVRLQCVQDNLDMILGIYPYLTYLFAFVLGWRFNRSALVFGAAAIALTHWCLMWFGPGNGFSQIYWRVAIASASLLLPVNLLVLSLAKERGIFTARGVSRFVLIMIQPLLVGMMAGRNPERYLALLEQDLVSLTPLSQRSRFTRYRPSRSRSRSWVIAFMYYRGQSAKESGLFWAVCAVYAALAATGSRPGWDSISQCILHPAGLGHRGFHAMAFRTN